MPGENIVNNSKDDALEEFLKNIESYPDLKEKFERDVILITVEGYGAFRNILKAAFKGSSFWDECEKDAKIEVLKTGNYLQQYEELKRKENQIIMEKEKGKENSVSLSDIEKNLYKEDGEKSAEFNDFYEKMKEEIKNENIDLRYFPTTAVAIDLGIKIDSEERWEGLKRRIGSDREHYYNFSAIADNKLQLNKVNQTRLKHEDNKVSISKHIELTDNDVHNNKYFTVSFFDKAAVLLSFFQHWKNHQNERIQLSMFFNENAEDVKDILKKNPQYMLGLLKEVSAMFPIDLYNCVKEKYSLFGNIGQYDNKSSQEDKSNK